MNKSWMKWVALGLCGLALLLFLVLPFFSALILEISGAELVFSEGEISAIITLIVLIAMIVLVLVDGKIAAGVVCCIGAILPLLVTLIGSASTEGLASPGIGVFLVLLLGAGAAVLCFMYGASCKGPRQPRQYQQQYGYSYGNQYSGQYNN